MNNSDLKSKLIKAALISAVAVTVSGSMTGCESKQVKELKDLLEAGAYSEAVNYYMSNRDKLADQNLDEVINASADNIYNSYVAGSIESDNAKSQLRNLEEIGSDESDKYIGGKIALIDSNGAYNDGLSYMENESYLNAIEEFKKVIENDLNYALAQSKIKEAEELYMKGLIKTAESYIEDNDYSQAISYLTGFLSKIENNQMLQDKIAEYKDKMLDAVLEDVNAFIKNGDYYNALVGIADLEDDYGDTKKLQDLKASTEKSYLDTVLPIIDDYVKAKDYVNAYTVCVNAMEVIDNSEELQKRYNEIEPLKPALLNEMKISESEYFEQLTDHTEIYEDVTGNTYNPGNLYRLHLDNDGWGTSETGYAKVYLNSQYTKLTGTLAMDDGSDTGDCIVTILLDDKEAYKETFSRTTEPKKVDIDVKGKQWMQIMISYPEESSDSSSSSSSTYKSDIFVYNFAFTK